VELKRFDSPVIELDQVSFAFDGDGDGVRNVLEHATCGRFDRDDGAAPPQACLDDADPCCAAVSPLEGHMTAFVGGAHTSADGTAITVAPFALDATEVTWQQLASCVAACACLVDQTAHPARVALAGDADPRGPVVGLNPAEAEALCGFFGKRLPLDEEWDFAAAHRDGGPLRARYPWDDAGGAVGCQTDFAGVAANFSMPGEACAGAPLPVGGFGSSHAVRGAGGPLADLGGNVAEWTLVRGSTAPVVPEVPAGHDAVVLRGGGALSPLALLENDLPVVARFPASGDADAWRASIARLAESAGVRCAVSVDDGTVEPALVDETGCGGDE
jgi:formylglycine-generating enzyme required for sulfatase activity